MEASGPLEFRSSAAAKHSSRHFGAIACKRCNSKLVPIITATRAGIRHGATAGTNPWPVVTFLFRKNGRADGSIFTTAAAAAPRTSRQVSHLRVINDLKYIVALMLHNNSWVTQKGCLPVYASHMADRLKAHEDCR